MSKTPDQWCDKAAELIRKGEKQEALADYDEAINIDPNFGRAYYEKAIALGGLGRDTEAVELYKKCIPLGYDIVTSHFNLAGHLETLDRYEEASESYTKAIQKDPKKVEAYRKRGNCLVMIDKAQEAVDSYTKAIELNPTDYQVYSDIGPLLEELGKKDEARKYYDTCISKDSKNFKANYAKGCLLFKEGKYQDSLKCLEIALSVNNLHPGVCYHVGSAHAALGNKDKSVEFFGKASQMKPELSIDYCHRGQCYYLTGKNNEALQDLLKAQDLLENDTKTLFLPTYVTGMKRIIMKISDADKIVNKIVDAIKQINQEDPAKKDSFANLKKQQEELNKAQNKMISKLHQKEGLEGMNEFVEVRKQLVEIQTSLGIQIVEPATEKTPDQWCDEGNTLKGQNKIQEALSSHNKALTIDTKFGRAYFCKALCFVALNKRAEAVQNYEKALAFGYNNPAIGYYNMGISLDTLGRREEAVIAYTKALERDPKKSDALSNRGNSLMMLGRVQEAVESYAKALELNPEDYPTYSDIGPLLEDLGRKEEAIKYYDTCLSKQPQNFRANYSKGCLFFREAKYQESIQYLEKALTQNSNHPGSNYFMGSCYLALNNKDKAMTYFSKADQMKPDFSVQFCNRGQCYFALGQKEKGLADFKKARELLESDRKTLLLPTYINFMKSALRSVLEAEDAAKQSEEKIKSLDQKNPVVQRFIKNIKKLQEDQDQLQNKVVGQFGQVKADEARKDINELDILKEKFQKQFDDMQKEIGQLKTQVKNVETEVKKIKSQIEEIQEELNNKMDDFNKKLAAALDKQDLSPEDKEKLKGYYSAFIGTFTSIYITSQVVDSGQVKLDAGTNTGTILSFIASFAPFVGSTLSNTISTLDEFLHSQEMIKNARRMKGLAHDTVALSQLIGQAGYEIVLDKKKQQAVLEAKTGDLRQVSGNLFQKVRKVCENLSDKLDAYLYTELYKSPAERVGHNDANDLVEKWVNDVIDPYDIQKQFVDEVLKEKSTKTTEPEGNSPTTGIPNTESGKRSACCNLF